MEVIVSVMHEYMNKWTLVDIHHVSILPIFQPMFYSIYILSAQYG
jgi:hypothetical protein